MESNWKPGPMPPNTYGWGGVVPAGEEAGAGFFFADFQGDSVKVVHGTGDRVLKAHEVASYNNSLGLPPIKK